MNLLRTVAVEFWVFGLKQAHASLFGGYLLFLILLTKWWYPFDGMLYRYDFLFIAAVLFQIVLLATGMEKPREAAVILIFHIVATVMEVFKTSDAIGSWHYPGEFRIGIGNVPLFAGFMYSAVGSYMARVWRIFDYRFHRAPPEWTTWILVTVIYINFFSHHYTYDLRWPLLIASGLLYGRCRIYFRIRRTHRWMPIVLAAVLTATVIWLAENMATYARIWVYPTQAVEWQMVPVSKLIAWYLLIFLSAVLVSLVQGIEPYVPEEFDHSSSGNDVSRSTPSDVTR